MLNSSQSVLFKEAALEYLGRGFSPIPVRPNKIPHIKGWPRYSQVAPTAAEVLGWSAQWPYANVGLMAGRDRAWIDIDYPQEAIARGLDLSVTPYYKTTRGAHYLYSTPHEIRKTPIPDIGDILSGRAFVIAPPSIIDGIQRQWIIGLDEVTLAPLPDWALELASTRQCPLKSNSRPADLPRYQSQSRFLARSRHHNHRRTSLRAASSPGKHY